MKKLLGLFAVVALIATTHSCKDDVELAIPFSQTFTTHVNAPANSDSLATGEESTLDLRSNAELNDNLSKLVGLEVSSIEISVENLVGDAALLDQVLAAYTMTVLYEPTDAEGTWVSMLVAANPADVTTLGDIVEADPLVIKGDDENLQIENLNTAVQMMAAGADFKVYYTLFLQNGTSVDYEFDLTAKLNLKTTAEI